MVDIAGCGQVLKHTTASHNLTVSREHSVRFEQLWEEVAHALNASHHQPVPPMPQPGNGSHHNGSHHHNGSNPDGPGPGPGPDPPQFSITNKKWCVVRSG